MATPVMIPPPVTVDNIPIHGKILAIGVSHDEFMQGYEGQRVEWVNGTVIEMPSIDEEHDALIRFLENMLEACLHLMGGGGRICQENMIMRLPDISSRAPDLLVLLPENLARLQRTEIIGPADLVIEIISPGSHRTDRVEKFAEYEAGGVPEYWILDPKYQEPLFYQLDEDGKYQRISPDEAGVYRSKVLPKLHLPIALLWQKPLPDIFAVIEMVKAMFSESIK